MSVCVCFATVATRVQRNAVQTFQRYLFRKRGGGGDKKHKKSPKRKLSEKTVNTHLNQKSPEKKSSPYDSLFLSFF